MKAIEIKFYIYADNDEEVEQCRKSIHQFIDENRNEGRAITAKKLTEALSKWKNNPLIKMGIINFFKN